MKQRILLVLALVIGFSSYYFFLDNVQEHATMVFINGKVYTCDEHNTVAEAVAINGNKIVGVGSTEYILKRFRTADTVDLQGKTVLPGLIDAHTHMLGLGNMLQYLNLIGKTTPEEIAGMVKQKVDNSQSNWIMGRGWDQNLWAGQSFPTHQMLDQVAGSKYVVLSRVDGHAFWVNKNVLDLAKISRSTPDPDGGKIIRDANGEPTGTLIDNAMDVIDKIIPEKTDAEIEQSLLLAANECVKYGLTEVQDMGVDLKVLSVYEKIIKEDKLPLRVYAALTPPKDSSFKGSKDTWDYFFYYGPLINYRDRLTVRSVKLYMDGALGSRGAAMIMPYSDDAQNRGLTMMSEEEITQICKEALAKGFQVCTHAIGDRANHIVLNGYEKALKDYKGPSPRFRIEHVQVLDSADVNRFKELKIIPSMQPTHATSDMYWAEDRLGRDRMRYAYAWRSILNTGMPIAGGSDFPVEGVNPLWGFFAACTRADKNNYPESGWYGSQKMTREEALKAFTYWAADAAFEEDWKGSIVGGKIADLTILSKDIMEVPQKEILDAQVEWTIVGGKIVYQKTAISN